VFVTGGQFARCLRLAEAKSFNIQKYQSSETSKQSYSQMNTPITPRLLSDAEQPKFTNVMLYDLKPIRETIEQGIKSFGKRTNLLITNARNNVDADTVEITITIQHHPRGPGGGDPPHPPKKAFAWE